MATMGKALKVHPVASLFPEMSATEYSALKDDIRERGLMEPIWLAKDGRIIDGRHRYRACRELKIEPTCIRNKYDDDATIAGVVVSLNLKRRHLNESQRAMVAARLKPMFEKAAQARMKAGKAQEPSAKESKGKAAQEAAETMNVGTRSVEHAARVLELATRELVRAVDTGEVAVSAAVKLAKYPEELQRKILAMLEDGRAKTVKAALKSALPPPQAPTAPLDEGPEIAALKITNGTETLLLVLPANTAMLIGTAKRVLAKGMAIPTMTRVATLAPEFFESKSFQKLVAEQCPGVPFGRLV